MQIIGLLRISEFQIFTPTPSGKLENWKIGKLEILIPIIESLNPR
jgi:hypothetical protein